MKKVLYFLGLFAYVLGAIGGFGYALYDKAWPVAASVIVLAIMAFPTAKDWYKKLIP